jgi:uncharacterized membrane protein
MAYNEKAVIMPGIRWLFLDKDLMLVVTYALITGITVYLPIISETMFRSAVCLGLVLFVPGYTLMAALFPGKTGVNGLERVVLSFGMSIAVTPLIGVALNFTPFGIRLDPIIISLIIFSIVCAFIANWRRLSLGPDNRFDAGQWFKKLAEEILPAGKGRLDTALTVVLLLSIMMSIILLAYVVMMPRHVDTFTEFYLLGPDGKAEGYPIGLTLGETGTVTVGVANHEQRDVVYDLAVLLNDSGNTSQLHAEKLLLQDNQTRERAINITPDRAGRNMTLDFLLYADNRTAPYRELRLWVNVSSQS